MTFRGTNYREVILDPFGGSQIWEHLAKVVDLPLKKVHFQLHSFTKYYFGGSESFIEPRISTGHLRSKRLPGGLTTRTSKFSALVVLPLIWVWMEEAGATGETKAGRQGWLLCTVYQLNDGATRWAPRPLVSCWGMNRPAWLFAQDVSFRPSGQVSGKGSLRFWSTARDFVLIFFFLNTGYVVSEVNKAVLVLNHLIIGSCICSTEVRKQLGRFWDIFLWV